MASSTGVVAVQQQALKLFSRKAIALSLPIAAGSIVMFLQWRKRRTLRTRAKPKNQKPKLLETKEQSSIPTPETAVVATPQVADTSAQAITQSSEDPMEPSLESLAEVAPEILIDTLIDDYFKMPLETIVEMSSETPFEVPLYASIEAPTEISLDISVESPTEAVLEAMVEDQVESPWKYHREEVIEATAEPPVTDSDEVPAAAEDQPPNYHDNVATVSQSRRVPSTHIHPNVHLVEPIKPVSGRKRSREDSYPPAAFERLPGMGIPNKKRDIEVSFVVTEAKKPEPVVEDSLLHLPGFGHPSNLRETAPTTRIPIPAQAPTQASAPTPTPALAPAPVLAPAAEISQPKFSRVERPRLGRGRSVEKVQSYAALSNLPGYGLLSPPEEPMSAAVPLSPRASDRPRPTRGRFSEENIRKSSIPQPSFSMPSAPLAHLPGMGLPNSHRDITPSTRSVLGPITGNTTRWDQSPENDGDDEKTPGRFFRKRSHDRKSSGDNVSEDVFTSEPTSPNGRPFIRRLKSGNVHVY